MRTIIMIFICFLFSCKSENELEFQLRLEGYVNDNFEDYADLYNKVHFWIEESKKLKRENVKSLIFSSDFKVDKLLLFNRDKNKLVGTINLCKSNRKAARNDWVFMFWGVKIGEKWYFTKGGNLFVPRENYKYNINEALSHFQLSYIGRDYFLKYFLNINGERISVNFDIINEHVVLKEGYKDNRDTDEKWMKFFKERYSKIVSQKEIDDINESIKNEVEEEHILPEKGSKAYKKLYGTKTPLFEREEWKAYEAQLKETN